MKKENVLIDAKVKKRQGKMACSGLPVAKDV
jgi:hypothetical protein